MHAQSLLKAFRRGEGGNFGILTAGVVLALAATAGVAVDVNRMIDLKSQLQAAADAGALAGVTEMAVKGLGETSAEKIAYDHTLSDLKLLAGNSGLDVVNPQIVADATISMNAAGVKVYDVAVTVSNAFDPSSLTRLMGSGSRNVSVTSDAVNDGGGSSALSLFLVLDTSGSMEDEKIQGLKEASRELLTVLDDLPSSETLVRTGGTEFSGYVKDTSGLTFTMTTTRKFVNGLDVGGATNSAPAMKVAYNQLMAAADDQAHLNSSGSRDPEKFIVFMSDGENTADDADEKTLETCAAAKAAGITIFSVAFRMYYPNRVLKPCATAGKFFNAANENQLIAAFKTIAAQVAERKPTGSRLKS